jgi:hypothetical protein
MIHSRESNIPQHGLYYWEAVKYVSPIMAYFVPGHAVLILFAIWYDPSMVSVK